MVTEENFVEELKNRNVEAVDYIFNFYGNYIYKIAYNILKNKEFAEESLNDSLLKIWIKSESFNIEKGEFITWIGRITKNLAIDMLRKTKNFKLEGELNEKINLNKNIEDEVEGKLEIKEIEKMLDNLKPIDRYIFVSKFFIGKKVKEIAKELDVTEGYINLRIYRTRKKLGNLVKL